MTTVLDTTNGFLKMSFQIAEIKFKNRARLEAKQANQLFNIDYTKDRLEIKVKY